MKEARQETGNHENETGGAAAILATAEGPGAARNRALRSHPGAWVVGAIIAGAVLLIQGAQDRARLNEATAMVNEVRASVQHVFAGQSDYSNLDAVCLHARGKMPGSSVTDDGSDWTEFVHPFGWQFSVRGQANCRFVVTLNNLDHEACEDLLKPYLNKTRATSGLIQVAVRATSTPTSSGAGALVPLTSIVDPVAADSSGVEGRGAGAASDLPLEDSENLMMCEHGQEGNEIVFQFSG